MRSSRPPRSCLAPSDVRKRAGELRELLNRASIAYHADDDPIMIAMVDEEEKINKMITALETMISGGCLIAVSDVTVVKYVEHAEGQRQT